MKQILFSVLVCLAMVANGQTNLIQDSYFESADLSRVFSQTYPNVYYNVWTTHVIPDMASNTTFSMGSDPERNGVAQMSNGGTGIANANAWKAFIAQRLQITATPALYKMSFWAKASAVTNPVTTARIFVKIAGSTNKFFIFDTGKPTSPTGTYTAFAKNLPLTTSWQYFENVLDFSKTTTSFTSIAYNTAATSTTEDLTNFAVCIQNNAANSTFQIDDVSLTLESNTALPALESGAEMKLLQDGKSIYIANAYGKVDVIDVQGRAVESKQVDGQISFDITKAGMYFVKYKASVRKVFVK